MNTEKYFDEKKLLQCLYEETGLQISGLQAIQIKPDGNSVWQGMIDQRPVIVRVACGRNALAMEGWVYDRLRNEGIPCPEVLAYIDQLPGMELPCLVMTMVEGIKLNDAPERLQDELHFKLGALLRQIHSIELSGFGELVKPYSYCRGKNDSWTEHWWVDDYLQRLAYCLQHDLLSHSEVLLLQDNFEQMKEYALPKGVLLHGDLSGDNTLVIDGDISGIIDVEGAMSGDPWFEIATSFVWQDVKQRRPFIKGYGDYDQQRVYNYLLWVLSFKLAWRHQHQKIKGVRRARQVMTDILADKALF
jgi:aminoglycoside phosphotransferase